MSTYTPNKWMVIKINSKNPHYRVFASWSGGYLDGDSWKMNSGITKVTLVDGFYHFEGSSGSVYKCREGMYGGTAYSISILNGMIRDAKGVSDIDIDVLPADTQFLEIEYE